MEAVEGRDHEAHGRRDERATGVRRRPHDREREREHHELDDDPVDGRHAPEHVGRAVQPDEREHRDRHDDAERDAPLEEPRGSPLAHDGREEPDGEKVDRVDRDGARDVERERLLERQREKDEEPRGVEGAEAPDEDAGDRRPADQERDGERREGRTERHGGDGRDQHEPGDPAMAQDDSGGRQRPLPSPRLPAPFDVASHPRHSRRASPSIASHART
jgi:hypothetical protein